MPRHVGYLEDSPDVKTEVVRAGRLVEGDVIVGRSHIGRGGQLIFVSVREIVPISNHALEIIGDTYPDARENFRVVLRVSASDLMHRVV